MNITVYGLTSCDTCKKALKSLHTAGHDVTYIDVRKDGVSAKNMAKFHHEFGATLCNTRSTTWRNLTESQRAKPVLELLAEHPTLMKRPVLEVGDSMYLGWTKDVQEKLLG